VNRQPHRCHNHTLTTMRHHAPTPRRPRDAEPPRPGAPAPPCRRALVPPCSPAPVYLLLQSMILMHNGTLTLLGPYAASSFRFLVVLCLPALVLLMPLASPSLIEGQRVPTSAPRHTGLGWQGLPPTLRSGRGVCEARLLATAVERRDRRQDWRENVGSVHLRPVQR